MANPRACLMLLLLSAYLCFMAHATALSFSYDFSTPGDLHRANLTYINDSSNSSVGVSLTKVTTWSTGRVAYPQSVRLWDERTGKRASFTTDFTFAINRVAANSTGGNSPPATNGSTTDDGNERGDGMAFFVGPFPASLPPDSRGSFLGLFSNYSDNPSWPPPQTVGVEFDTCKNPGDPSDVTADHIGIDINNISSINYTKLPNLALSGTMSASIRYDGRSKIMSVSLRVQDGSPPYTLQQTQVDLRDAGVPQDAAVGFSAATGGLVESHQLLSWSFSSTDPSSKTELWVIILIALASASLAAGLVAALLCVVMRKQRPAVKVKLKVVREFSYQELAVATKNFAEDGKLGKGAFGEVYRGKLRDPSMPPVAVKKLTMTSLGLERTRKDYVTEINTLGELSHRNLVKLLGWCSGGGELSHRNLVKLLGWCSGGGELVLVYELVTNGSLEEHLYGPPERPLLAWPERYKIVLGVGAAIDYLHTGNPKSILHRDIKPSNVMLDDNFDAKLGDFGLVRQVDSEKAFLEGTSMIGTTVYMDPICISSNKFSTASDMYSFGVLLLEIAAGVKPEVQGAAAGGHLSNTLVEAVRESYARGAVLEMADKRLEGNFNKSQMERVLAVGRLCVQLEPQHRPGIKRAVNLLWDLSLPVVG